MSHNRPNETKGFYEAKYAAGEEILRTCKLFTLDCVPAAPPALDVLDVGCATGSNTSNITSKGHRVTGVDISENAIEKYKARGFDGHVMDISAGLDFADESYDLVFCSEVIEHLVRPEELVREFARVLRPGGRLVLSTPNSAFWAYRFLGLFGITVTELQHPMHLRFFSKRSLTRALTCEGLAVEQVLGRNMYALLPDPGPKVAWLLRRLGFKEEVRFRTGKRIWHLSAKSSRLNSFFADTLIAVAVKNNNR